MQSGVFAIACQSSSPNGRSAYAGSNIPLISLMLLLLYNQEDPIIIAALLLNVQVFGVPDVFHPMASRIYTKWFIKSSGLVLVRPSKPVEYTLLAAISESISIGEETREELFIPSKKAPTCS